MKDTTLYMIGNAHLDPVWLWTWQEGFQEAKATFRSVLDRMQESDDFLFTSSQAAVYEWVERNDPRMFEEIRARVAEGRWYISGGWWLQPDCNLLSGESFVRQVLYGHHYFKEKFGVRVTIGYNVDSFGHHAMLPQFLRKSGMDSYIFTRPEAAEKGLPNRVFWWESDDGSRVLAFRIPYEYCTWGKDLEKYVRRTMRELKQPYNGIMMFYGVGNHGGGPTRENIESIRRMDADPQFPALKFSTPRRFFDDMLASGLPFPVVHDELQHHASGCYSVHSGIKRWNREAENRLAVAEKFSAFAQLVTGQPYPAELREAWKNVLFNQFHDLICGTCVEPAYDDAQHLHGEAMAIAGRSLNYAIQSLSWNIHIEPEEGMKPIVVFNPHAWAAKLYVELEFGGHKEGDILVDDEDRQVPLQVLRPSALVSGWRQRLGFVAELPSLGYRVFRVVPRPRQIAVSPIQADDLSLENDRFRLRIDPDSGYISELHDKQHGVDVLLGEGARPVVIEDRSDTWSHGVYQFHAVAGSFRATSVKRVEHGPVKSTLRVESEYDRSRLVQEFTMYRELDQIDVQVTVDWHEQFKMLKLLFPVNLNFLKATYEIPYGFIERPTNGEEEPALSWIDLSGVARGVEVPYGLSILNDGKYSFHIKGREMAVTVLRSPIYAHHDPTQPAPGADYTFMDQGIQRFTYSLVPHFGSWEQAGTIRRAAELNQRPVALVESYHAGSLPQRDSYLAVEPANIVVGAVKQAEADDALIVRCYETDRVPTAATIRLPRLNRSFEAEFGPCEIKTFRVPRDAAAPVTETSLLDWELE